MPMMSEQSNALPVKPESLSFKGRRVYFSGPIANKSSVEDAGFSWQLVQYMASGGAEVLSEYVAARTKEEREKILATKEGVELDEILSRPEPWFGIRRQDLKWVDKATHFVAVVNGPSHGVGMELERAILKPNLGLNVTPILCLVQEDLLAKLTYMIRGISMDECPDYYLQTYHDLEHAKEIVRTFLNNTTARPA
jgi:hypothetical protein